MTVLYLVTRYIAMPYSVYVIVWPTSLCCTNSPSLTTSAVVLLTMTSVSLTDTVSNILFYARSGTNSIVTAMLGVIMIARLHAMYQGSRMMFIFLVIIFLAVNVACAAIAAIELSHTVAKELIVSGTYMCSVEDKGDGQPLPSMIWTFNTIWRGPHTVSFSLAVKHFLDLRRLGPSTGSTIGNCFRVLIKSHVLYFAR
ncbi:uncharacterized protein HD556DRAFT_184242 [Suillus plorans]|uniref:Uncharacterized protein n=1 Tax=Suillus plorans TaxID=116603 RepID=A0A9P7DMG7_9AGAM|nr:uncharacterized protein HD556DRAFT_184242 [Suillus plorans]KAG1798453.1 hypothetical protein HD556DRAFT_184242 [Suillus plorans]